MVATQSFEQSFGDDRGRRGIRTPLAVSILLALSSEARGDDDAFEWHLPERSYLWDGGAVPFLYAPLALTAGLKLGADPPDTPLMFSRHEGGRRYDGGQYPPVMLYVDAALAGGLIVAGGDDSRWHHLKGLAQSLATSAMLTTTAKNVFGRHRPHFDLELGADNPDDARRSFWSGHASSTIATATYLGLYARRHLFNRWRPAGTFVWWEGVAYAGLATAALAVPYSQYRLNRHHASDVVTGSLVGATVSTAFFVYQERRYQRSKSRERDDDPLDVVIVPNTAINGITITGSW